MSDYIKTEVSNQFGTISSQVQGQGDAIMSALDAMQEVRKAIGNLQQKTSIGGTEGKEWRESMNKAIMEHRVISNLDKLTNDANGFQMRTLRLKNTALIAIDNMSENIMSHYDWNVKYGNAIQESMKSNPGQYERKVDA